MVRLLQEFEGDLHTPTVQPITDKTMDVFMKKYEEFMRKKGGAPEAPPQQQPPQMERGEGFPLSLLQRHRCIGGRSLALSRDLTNPASLL
jgi:hypothetical protein